MATFRAYISIFQNVCCFLAHINFHKLLLLGLLLLYIPRIATCA